MSRNVLIIDDDPLFRRALKYELQDTATAVYYAESVQQAMLCLAKNDYALIIMDTQLTGTDGVGLLGAIHQARLSVPIMILTSNDNLAEQLMALEIGADVVLEKKAGPLEYLVGHARALILHNEERKSRQVGPQLDLLIDISAHIIRVNGEQIKLTKKEFDIFAYIAGNPNIVLTRTMIYERIWHWENVFDIDETVRYYIKNLRKKLSVGGRNYIETVHGIGYKFNPRGIRLNQ